MGTLDEALRSLGRRVLRWVRRAAPRGTGFESSRNLAKWLLLGTSIGLVAGGGAIVFFLGIEAATRVLLGGLVGYRPPMPAGEGLASGVAAVSRPWLLPLVTAAGGLLSGVIVFFLAPEAEGHGTDAAIDAIHRHGSRIRARIPPVKLLASVITIGSGGSAGREGPTAQISAGFGSLLGRWLLTDPQDRRIAVAAGIGAGIGAIFRAPLGGALLAAEILYTHDIEVEAIVPSLIASIAGYAVYGGVFGYGPIFGAHPALELGNPVQLAYYAVLGIVSGFGGILYARGFYGISAWFRRLKLPRWLVPAIGGLGAGLVGLLVPQAIHTGYGWVQIFMTRDGLLAFPLAVILLVPFAKIIATSLTIGSGGSGGIFGPGMVIGGTLGALMWRLGLGLPGLPADPAPFVIIGMMALFGSIAHAPLAVMLMVAEMTGSLSLLAPAMIAVAVATALVGDETIYRTQLKTRASSPAHRAHVAYPILSTMVVREALPASSLEVAADAPAAGALRRMVESGASSAVVVDRRGAAIGSVGRAALERLDGAERDAPVASVADRVVLRSDQTLFEALQAISEAGASRAAVVDHDAPIGVLAVQDVLRAYGAVLRRTTRRAPELPPGMAIAVFRLAGSARAVGLPVSELRLPPQTLVVAITRDGGFLFPDASTRLAVGDLVTVLTLPAHERAVAALFEPAGTSDSASA
jgi:CIC family chloride channel protein